jgi:hypothetical protein
LMVGAAGDSTVPFAGQRELHAELPGSRLVTAADSFDHVVFLGTGNPCVDTVVNHYLLDGPLPATDVTCPRP